MPKSVAKKVLAQYFGRKWVDNPVGFYAQGFGFLCGNNGWGALPFDEINVMRVVHLKATTIHLEKTNWLLAGIPCQIKNYVISGQFSEQDIGDITDALVSLGAQIKEVKK